MANGKGTINTNWSVLIAAGALILAIAGNVFGVLSGGTEKIEKRVSQIENDLPWKYVSKEVLAKDIDYLRGAVAKLERSKTEQDVYEQKVTSIERQLSLLRERLKDLDHSVNQTFNARDAMTALQARILELERATRK